MKQLLQLCAVQFKSFYREPGTIFWALLFPVLMSWVLGVAFDKQGEAVKKIMLVWDEANGKSKLRTVIDPASSESEKKLGGEIYTPTKIYFEKGNMDQAITALKRGEISIYIEEKADCLIYHFDPKNPEAQNTYLLLEREFNGKKESFPQASISPVTEKGSRYIDFLIPGLIAMGIMNSCIWGISYNLIEYRMKKLLRRMIATPMKKSYFLLAQVLTRVTMNVVEAMFLFIFAYFYFGVSVTGSIPALILIFLAGIFAFCGIAILISSRVQNTYIGNGVINAAILPMTVLSGVFFSYHNFPDWAVSIIKVLPLTMLADGMRSIFIEGYGLEQTIPLAGILIAEGIISFAIGLKIYKWH